MNLARPSATLSPLSVYVHIPWCVRKCPYCDFNSHEKNLSYDENRYLEALALDIEQTRKLHDQESIVSIFFGGGTPSIFSGRSIGKILSELNRHFTFDDDIEITLEANPGTVEQSKFKDFLAAGVNRLSIGVQSFNQKQLTALGRIHSADDASLAIRSAKRAGFKNINLDLMYALPAQSAEDAERDLETAVELEPSHISYYQLTIEPNTYFHRYPPPTPGHDLTWRMHEQGLAYLQKSGYQQYEVSAFCQPGLECRHNLNYWTFGDYAGIGAGAHGKCSLNGQRSRYWKAKHPQRFMESITMNGPTEIDHNEIDFEVLLNGLRLNNGFSKAEYERNTGRQFQPLVSKLQQLVEDELLICTDNRVAPTPSGHLYLNEILERLLPG